MKRLIKKRLFYPIAKIFPTKLFLKIMYKRNLGKKLNFKNPQTLNEKIQWKKIYDKNPLYTVCADKYCVRDYIKEKIGEKYLIPLLYSTDNPSSINFGELKFPCILKSSHGSAHIIILKNKKYINKRQIIKKCKKWLKTNYYWVGREPQYKNIKPLILIERLLLDEKGKIPHDYKFYCFNGKVEFIQVNKDRFGESKFNIFNKYWESTQFTYAPKEVSKEKRDKNIAEPKNLKKMIKVAEKLSKDFDFARVDLYSVNNKIYFGEITFHPGSGFCVFLPSKYDLIYGKKLKLKGHQK